jgi:cytochrome P450
VGHDGYVSLTHELVVRNPLRVDGPVPFVPRVTTAEVTLSDVTIPAGSLCWLVLGAANRKNEIYGHQSIELGAALG